LPTQVELKPSAQEPVITGYCGEAMSQGGRYASVNTCSLECGGHKSLILASGDLMGTPCNRNGRLTERGDNREFTITRKWNGMYCIWFVTSSFG